MYFVKIGFFPLFTYDKNDSMKIYFLNIKNR